MLIKELKHQLKTDYVKLSPWPAYIKNKYQIKIEITEFDGVLGGENKLAGSWYLLNAKGNKLLQQFEFQYTDESKEKNYDSMVKSLSHLIVQLTEDIAKKISALTESK